MMKSTSISAAFPDPRNSPRYRSFLATKSGLDRKFAPENHRGVSAIRVVSYNLLADMYLKTGRESYDHCPKQCLTWEYRRENMLKELKAYKAEVLCLQEVQSDHYRSFFEPKLAEAGYAAFYQARKSQLYDGKSHVADGCAIFYKRGEFNLVKSHTVEYAKMAEKISDSDRKNRMRKDNLAIVVILERIRCGSMFCVANTHLSSGKNFSDVRKFQAESLLRGLKKIESLGFPVLVCGDMNSEPNSDVHKILTHSLESAYEKDGLTDADKFFSKNRGIMTSEKALEGHEDETLDYIMFSKAEELEWSLRLDAVLKFPVYESKQQMRQLPTNVWSSDHIALVADFRIIKKAYYNHPYEYEKMMMNRMTMIRDLPNDPWDEDEMKRSPPLKKPRMTTIGQPYYPKPQTVMLRHPQIPLVPAGYNHLAVPSRCFYAHVPITC